MLAERGLTVMELDRRASTAESPYGIITADCSDPREIDDGIFVEPLPTAQETYRVGVCVADTSKLYEDGDVFKQAMRKTQATYWDLPDGERGYDPMIESGIVRDLEFTAGEVRNALIVTFIVGKCVPPSDVQVVMGKVEVTENLNYKDFVQRCRDGQAEKQFARAGALIIKHLRYNSGGDYENNPAMSGDFGAIYNRLVHAPSRSTWLAGSRLNEAYMVAANHLVGQLLADEERPAIYRVHDPSDETYLEFLPPDIATYSRTPGLHAGLNLQPYCRVTSPLRRLEDFMMSYQLRQRYLDRAPTLRDARDIAAAIQRLNGYVIREFLQGPLRLNKHDALGKGAGGVRRTACRKSDVIPLHIVPVEAEAV